MKATIYVPRTINIPDAELPRLARLAAAARHRYNRRAKRPHSLREFPVTVEEIIRQAIRAGLVKLDDYATGCDEDRVWHRGRLRQQREVWDEQKKGGAQ
jgi:hypothetical protein